MTGKQHVAIGIVASVFATSYVTFGGDTNVKELLTMDGCIILGSLLPDIDHPSSILGQNFKLLSKIVNKFLGDHRGATHDFMWVVVLSVISCLFWKPWHGLFVGISIHILADAFCVGGVPFFWIVNKKKRYRLAPKFMCCKCGSFYSYIITASMCAGILKLASLLWR